MSTSRPKGSEPYKEDDALNLPEMDSQGKPRQRGVRHGIADADKIARTGSKDEPVRDTPPAGAWNDVSDD